MKEWPKSKHNRRYRRWIAHRMMLANFFRGHYKIRFAKTDFFGGSYRTLKITPVSAKARMISKMLEDAIWHGRAKIPLGNFDEYVAMR